MLHAQPANLVQSVQYCPTGVNDAFGQPIVTPCGFPAFPMATLSSGPTMITASATGTTGATTATLAGAAALTDYLCGFSMRSTATAAVTGNATVTGLLGGTLNFTHWTGPVASAVGITEENFDPCLPASAVNTAIAVISPAPGTAGVISVTAWGYRK
jgi:hypothetical protein